MHACLISVVGLFAYLSVERSFCDVTDVFTFFVYLQTLMVMILPEPMSNWRAKQVTLCVCVLLRLFVWVFLFVCVCLFLEENDAAVFCFCLFCFVFIFVFAFQLHFGGGEGGF